MNKWMILFLVIFLVTSMALVQQVFACGFTTNRYKTYSDCINKVNKKWDFAGGWGHICLGRPLSGGYYKGKYTSVGPEDPPVWTCEYVSGDVAWEVGYWPDLEEGETCKARWNYGIAPDCVGCHEGFWDPDDNACVLCEDCDTRETPHGCDRTLDCPTGIWKPIEDFRDYCGDSSEGDHYCERACNTTWVNELCDEHPPGYCPDQGHWCSDNVEGELCGMYDRDKYEHACRSDKYGCEPLKWNIGGTNFDCWPDEPGLQTECCCGDDGGTEFVRTCEQAGVTICDTDPDPEACCNSSTDCVYNNICYDMGWSGTIASVEVKCIKGVWYEVSPAYGYYCDCDPPEPDICMDERSCPNWCTDGLPVDRDFGSTACLSTGTNCQDRTPYWDTGHPDPLSSDYNPPCCGDDNSEYERVCHTLGSKNTGADCPPSGDPKRDACCDAPGDCVDQNGRCFAQGACYGKDVMGKSMCLGGAWYDPDVNEIFCPLSCGEWNIGGDISNCCGDDYDASGNPLEFVRTCEQAGVTICDTDPDPEACCNSDTDCVYDDVCYDTGYVGNVDGDQKIEKCVDGKWQFEWDCNVEKGYPDVYNNPLYEGKCSGHNYYFYSSANQMRQYYASGPGCDCNVAYDSFVTSVSAEGYKISGCPILKVYNGNKFVDVEKLDIHAPEGVDTTYTSTFTMEPIEDGKYKIILSEAWYALLEGSHMDYVKLMDEQGGECRLVSAIHSKDGDVLSKLRESDDVRVETKPGEDITLMFTGCTGDGFSFTIEGYNSFPMVMKAILAPFNLTVIIITAIVLIVLVFIYFKRFQRKKKRRYKK